ncbi:MAG: sulfotransferase [Rubricoccaceae bacterium]|nr:sulfotransferase [Rubricoccaceae bacterium]
MPPDPPPFCLIGGSGRSGTTILYDVFARHPAVAAFPELRFPTDPDGLADVLRDADSGWTPFAYDLRVRRLLDLLRRAAADPPVRKAWRLLARLAPRAPRKLERRYLGLRACDVCPPFLDHVAALEARLTGFAYDGTWVGLPAGSAARMRYHAPWGPDALADALGTFWQAVAADTCRHAGRPVFLEKETWSILHLDTLRRLVPHARLVHIVRDPRDVVASYTRQRWAPSDPVHAAEIYRDVMARWEAVRARVPAEAVHDVRLEDLVADPRGVLEGICEFWGIDWDDALLATDLGRSHARRWRRDLPVASHAAVEALVAPVLHAYGYEA